jgi:uncharacterized protein with NRDE domain
MCTVVILRRPGHDWPLLLAGNRDEMADRPWRAPGRHWPDRPDVVAGLDELAGGSWMGLNDRGVAATILNRTGTLGPATGKRSRGEIVLEALDHADAADAAAALAELDPEAYRPFNLVIADNRDAFWLAHRGDGRIETTPLPAGLSILTERDVDDRASPRIARYLDRFRESPAPEPTQDDWTAWQTLLEDRTADPALGAHSALAFTLPSGFGTVSHSLLALPAPGIDVPPAWRFAAAAAAGPEWLAIEP